MRFEVGKAYRHTTGLKMQVISEIDTYYYGKCLLGETDSAKLVPLGVAEDNAINWVEITIEEFKNREM